MTWSRQASAALVMATVAFISSVSASEAKTTTWQTIVEQSKGQTVYFNAWGGEVNRSMITLTGLLSK
ncbi:hypothetical protein [Endozoicomonas sp. GU-1]|uniref:hypothetical protein n=1 Tax=Endozoicomonas sp. GU-1 TaxID=3009078 RepID=UPI0022B5078E|nr:hypothetical protein [Endozoicomonas sp. GU-1]WBA81337.1 hypothetical protein O2T12_24145 [Endozoicomonas sp. GU-1]